VAVYGTHPHPALLGLVKGRQKKKIQEEGGGVLAPLVVLGVCYYNSTLYLKNIYHGQKGNMGVYSH
jgi:hypothetical protein